MRPAVSGLVTLLLIAGCSSSEGVPQTLPPAPPVTETPAPVPSASPIPLPAEAEVPDALGAQAFVEHYHRVLNEAYASSDSSELAQLFATSCNTCRQTVEAVDALRDAGERMVGAYLVVLESAAPPVEASLRSPVLLQFEQAAREIVGADGAVARSLEARPPQTVLVTIQFEAGAWTVLAIEPA